MITLDIFTPFAGTEESMSSCLSKLIVFPWNVSFLKKKEAEMHLFFVLSSSVQAPELTFVTAGVDLSIVTASFIVISRTLARVLVILKEGFQRIPTLGLTEDALFRLRFFGTVFCCSEKRKNPSVLNEELWGLGLFQTYVCLCVWPVKTHTGWDARATESALPSRIQSSFEKLQNQIKIRKMANWWPKGTACFLSF